MEGSERFVMSFVDLQGALLPALKLDAMSPGETKPGGRDDERNDTLKGGRSDKLPASLCPVFLLQTSQIA